MKEPKIGDLRIVRENHGFAVGDYYIVERYRDGYTYKDRYVSFLEKLFDGNVVEVKPHWEHVDGLCNATLDIAKKQIEYLRSLKHKEPKKVYYPEKYIEEDEEDS